MVRPYHSRSVKEADDDEAADAPARKADEEAFEIFDETSVRRKISVGAIRHRVYTRHTFEFFSEIFSVILDDVVVPENVKSTTVTSPTDKEDGAPKRHEDRESAGHW